MAIIRNHVCCIALLLVTASILGPGEAATFVRSGASADAAVTDDAATTELVQLKDIAIGILSGRKEYFEPVAQSMLRYAPRGTLLKAEGRCPCNFRAGFQALLKKHPDAKWYYIADDDVIIMLDKLVKMLRLYGENSARALAGNTMATYKEKCGGGTEAAPWAQMDPEGRCMFGGTGMILSAPFVHQIKWDEPCKCDMHDSDLEMTCFIGRSWNSSFKYEGLPAEKGFGNNPRNNDIMARSPYQNMVVVHRVKPRTLVDISDRNRVVGNATRTVQEVIDDAVPVEGACCGDDKPSFLEEPHERSVSNDERIDAGHADLMRRESK